jgi:hypothetical protein
VGVCLTWLFPFLGTCFAACPAPLYGQLPARPPAGGIHRLAAEAAAMESFVQKPAQKPWGWSALEATTRHIMALHGGIAAISVAQRAGPRCRRSPVHRRRVIQTALPSIKA